MQRRLEMLHRLVSLYAVVEEMHAAELQRMTSAVREAQQGIEVERGIAHSARMDARESLSVGDSMGWIMAETQQETAVWRRERLELLRREREELNDAAREQYLASKLKREQMKSVMDDFAARIEIEEGRREQSVSDDRFLARRRWTDKQERMRSDVQMKTC